MTDQTSPDAPPALKLVALDTEDLEVVSAHLQDATVRVGDMAYLPASQRFALVVSRFDWALSRQGPCERCATGRPRLRVRRAELHFERVSRVRRHGFDQDPERVLTLVAVVFVTESAPSGTVILTFSEGAAVRLDVECLEAALQDIGPRWRVECKPEPVLSEADGA